MLCSDHAVLVLTKLIGTIDWSEFCTFMMTDLEEKADISNERDVRAPFIMSQLQLQYTELEHSLTAPFIVATIYCFLL